MSKKDPIQNNEQVVAIAKSGERLPYRFGQLKQDFQSKKITLEIERVYVPRTKESFFVIMRPTVGVKFRKLVDAQ